MYQATLTAGQTSAPQAAGIGSVARLTISSGSGYVEYTTGSFADIGNNVATWTTWPKGTVGATAQDTAGFPMIVRFTCVTGTAAVMLADPSDAEFPSNALMPWESMQPGYAFNASGNVTGLVGPDGPIAVTSLCEPRFAPSWAYSVPWRTQRAYSNLWPSIYYDPSFGGSVNKGTYANPYNTVTQVQRACSGNMAGQTLGIKRGTTSSALALTCFGSAAAPFSIIPYGDGAAPIISGGVVSSAFTQYVPDNRIWQLTGLSAATDAWDTSIGSRAGRLYPVNGADLTARIAAMVSYIAAPVAGTFGCCTYNAGTLYVYLLAGKNPNGVAAYATATNALSVTYPVASGSAGINIIGLDVRYCTSGGGIVVVPASYNTGSGTLAPINVVGNSVAYCGSGVANLQGTSSANDGILVNGASAALRTSGYIELNDVYDVINCAVEINYHSGTFIQRNISAEIRGPSIAELYSACSACTIRWNRGVGAANARNNATGVGYNGAGVWIAPYIDITAPSYDNTGSVSNLVVNNYIQDAATYGLLLAGQNNVFAFNTLAQVTVGTPAWAGAMRFHGAAGATGNSAYGNLIYTAPAYTTFTVSVRIVANGADAGTPTPTLNYNAYVRGDASNNTQWDVTGGSTYTSLATWRTFTGGEANSVATQGTANIFATTFGASNLLPAYSTVSFGNGSLKSTAAVYSGAPIDIDGNPVASATPNIGAWQG